MKVSLERMSQQTTASVGLRRGMRSEESDPSILRSFAVFIEHVESGGLLRPLSIPMH